MLKKLTLLFLTIIIALVLPGCFAPSEPVTKEEKYPIALFLQNENVDGFVVKAVMTDGTPENIVSLLVDYGTLPEGCELISLTFDGSGGGVADMNDVYGQALNTGTAGEYIRLGSVVNTLLTFFELHHIAITIEGRVVETGHEIYDYPLHFYENQAAYR